jgi:hypothetical protein
LQQERTAWAAIRGLLGRLGQHRVAGGQRRAHLAGEDGQREVPGADADHRAGGLWVALAKWLRAWAA